MIGFDFRGKGNGIVAIVLGCVLGLLIMAGFILFILWAFGQL